MPQKTGKVPSLEEPSPKKGFERKWNIAQNDQGAVRCIANWNLDENAANAPRKQKIKGHDEKYYEFAPK